MGKRYEELNQRLDTLDSQIKGLLRDIRLAKLRSFAADYGLRIWPEKKLIQVQSPLRIKLGETETVAAAARRQLAALNRDVGAPLGDYPWPLGNFVEWMVLLDGEVVE